MRLRVKGIYEQEDWDHVMERDYERRYVDAMNRRGEGENLSLPNLPTRSRVMVAEMSFVGSRTPLDQPGIYLVLGEGQDLPASVQIGDEYNVFFEKCK